MCFASFQFIRDNFHAITNQMSTSFDINHLEGNKILVQEFLYLDLQPQNSIECQVAEKDLEARTYGQMIMDDSLPFCSESVQFLKGNLHSLPIIKDEKFLENHAVSLEPIEKRWQQSLQVFHDPIDDVLVTFVVKVILH